MKRGVKRGLLVGGCICMLGAAFMNTLAFLYSMYNNDIDGGKISVIFYFLDIIGLACIGFLFGRDW